MRVSCRRVLMRCAAVLGACCLAATAQAWEPSKPVQFYVPAGTGGGADQMARTIQAIVAKHNLMKQPIVVQNKGGGAGAEAFLEVKEKKGDAHLLLITLSSLFTTPLATGVPFRWTDITPVKMLALDEFVLWVNTESPWKSVAELVAAGKSQKLKMGGTGSRQEDHIITVAIGKATGAQFTYVPYKGGGEVAVQLVGGHVDTTVNNPIEAVSHWKAGKVRPLCVFDSKPMPYPQKITDTMSWADIPTCKSQGLDVEYLMLRGIFMPAGVTQEQVRYYIDLLDKVRATPEWKELMAQGAFNQSALEGAEFRAWLEREEERHRQLMAGAGFLAK